MVPKILLRTPPTLPCKKFPNPQMLTMCFLRYYIHASDYVSYKILPNMMMWHFDILNACSTMYGFNTFRCTCNRVVLPLIPHKGYSMHSYVQV